MIKFYINKVIIAVGLLVDKESTSYNLIIIKTILVNFG